VGTKSNKFGDIVKALLPLQRQQQRSNLIYRSKKATSKGVAFLCLINSK